MAPAESRIVVTREGEAVRVQFADRNILEEAVIAQIGEQINALVDAEVDPKLLLSFAGVEHMSSAALGMLIDLNNRIRGKGGQLRLSSINPQVYEVFVITALNKLFQIADNDEDALASFK